MTTTQTICVRQADGQSARKKVGRSKHAAVGTIDRDPIALLEANSEGRVKALVPLRYGRMAVSPFTFFRGSAILQAHDLSQTPHSGITVPICGDAHLANFGGFATPERELIFDLNDFDEVAVGPWEWDLKRLSASLVVASQHMGFDRNVAGNLVLSATREYRDRMSEYAQCGTLDLWYDRVTFARMVETAQTAEGRRRLERGMAKATGRTHGSMLKRMAVQRDGRWIMQDTPPSLFHPAGPASLLRPGTRWDDVKVWQGSLADSFDEYRSTLTSERQELLSHFHIQDMAFKVVGVGSVGTFCFVVLLTDGWDKPLFLQIKEARQSVIAKYFSASEPAHQGERVVTGQRLLQAASDIFLGWASGPDGRHFFFRQLRDMKISADIETLDATLLAGYARICGWALARAHAKASGKAVELSAYIGRSDKLPEALVEYSLAYAVQNEKDYRVFMDACRSGQLEARTDEDMAADFRV
ncbi:hypothetical protein R70006_03143 [Paraburkholderia domus]|uniref:DUF2252 domain-containing protein n=1 Tax=Paraburkholderia domus TaxID=2793075 RepID=UPI0019128F78|nr:DUF2252 domain-containing protein [Paraburkholderia domus]MBK5050508.1 DUF2252 domain-containing protein [Burkholderia sp. R-70006]CAE6753493.1 hypothetical protein R70006_03143 [Paraburkholderia domus]